MLLFALQFFVTNILFSLIATSTIIHVYSTFNKGSKEKKGGNNKPLLVLLLLGFGPALTSLMLNYLLLIIPGQKDVFYFLCILLIFTFMLWVSFRSFKQLLKDSYVHIKEHFRDDKIYFLLISLAILLFSVVWLYWISRVPLVGSDILTYGNQGKFLYLNRSATYKGMRYHLNWPYHFSYHGYLFPLLKTWNLIFNSLFGQSSDIYFRSISGFYWMLIGLVYLKYFYNKNKLLSVVGTITFITTPIFLQSAFYYHIDTFRIYLLIIGLYFLITSFDDENVSLNIAISGIFLGLASNAHTLGLSISAIFIFTYLLFKYKSGKNLKGAKTYTLIILLFFFGAFHYPLDLIFGEGWFFSSQLSSTKLTGRTYINVLNINRDVSNINLKLLPKPGDIIGKEERNLDTPKGALVNGYLRHFIKYDETNATNVIIIPIFIYILLNIRKLSNVNKIFISGYFISLLLLIVRGFPNGRYALTILPLTQFIILSSFFDAIKKGGKTLPLFYTILLTSTLFSVFQIASTYPTLTKNIINTTDLIKLPKIKGTDVVTKSHAHVNKGSSMSAVANYIERNIDGIFIVNNSNFFYYYTNQRGYYMKNLKKIYLENGPYTIPPDWSVDNYEKIFKKELKCNYIIMERENTLNDTNMLNNFIIYTGSVEYENSWYIIYKL